jgi:nicotinic acid mononucleotide adenylyltransferase
VLLLGAFDPPTNAHVEILAQAATSHDREPAWGMTKVLLDRPAAGLFTVEERIELVDAIAERTGAAFAIADAGTYLEVDRTLKAQGIDATFLIGSDKLAQLRDPSFYDDGDRGVAATFDDVAFLVVERDEQGLSATRVRDLVGRGMDVSALVPPEVAEALRLGGRGYTAAR